MSLVLRANLLLNNWLGVIQIHRSVKKEHLSVAVLMISEGVKKRDQEGKRIVGSEGNLNISRREWKEVIEE